MSQGSPKAAASSNSRQKSAPIPPNRSQWPPGRPRDGKSKRKLIESACTACQKRKSRCDGQRPICSRCRALHTECGYNAEEGESRWSALRRKIRTLETERDEAHDLLSRIQSKPEVEAQEIYYLVRSQTPTNGMGALIHDITGAIPPSLLQQGQLLQHQYQRQQQQQRRAIHDQQHEIHHLVQLQQRQQPQALRQNPPQQHLQQQRNPDSFFRSSYKGTGAANQLPPLRSMVEVPVSSIDRIKQQPAVHFQTTAQRQGRKMSQASGMSSDSHSSIPSSEAYDQHTLSPQDSPLDWAQGPKQ